MADPTVYDVMVDGKKVVGGAQRRTKHGFLHQGSISLGVPDLHFLRSVLKNAAVADLMRENSYPLAGPELLPTRCAACGQSSLSD